MASSPATSATPLTTSITSSAPTASSGEGSGKAGQAPHAAVARRSAAPAVQRALRGELSEQASSESAARPQSSSSSPSGSDSTEEYADQEEAEKSLAVGKAGSSQPGRPEPAGSDGQSSHGAAGWLDSVFGVTAGTPKMEDVAGITDEIADPVYDAKVHYKARANPTGSGEGEKGSAHGIAVTTPTSNLPASDPASPHCGLRAPSASSTAKQKGNSTGPPVLRTPSPLGNESRGEPETGPGKASPNATGDDGPEGVQS